MAIKPNIFSWDTVKKANGKFNLGATEWNNFMETLCEEVEYVGYNRWGYTTAEKGASFTAGIYNEAVNILKNQLGMGGYGTLDFQKPGNEITSLMLNNLVSELNQAINTYTENSKPMG